MRKPVRSMPQSAIEPSAERSRLREADEQRAPWRLWGPYLSEREWGTVREDYSPDGNAWDYLPHDHARSRAYRWGEDGLAGFSDDECRLCLSLALWNGKDPILKERLFGLTNSEGNHGEDVKELYYYLDATPTHSYLKMLYKYPHEEFPYSRLVHENKARGSKDPEFELLDSGVFDGDRYFDVFVEYAKAAPDDILMEITVHNRGPKVAEIHVLPQLWFRNTWSWGNKAERPEIVADGKSGVSADHAELGVYRCFVDGDPHWLFCENETNAHRLFGVERGQGSFKDAFHEYLVSGHHDAGNANNAGTKAAAHCSFAIPAGASQHVRLRLTASTKSKDPFAQFDEIMATRRREADEFYAELQQGMSDEDARRVQRQALAGMIWSKQLFNYDVPQWLRGDPNSAPPPPQRLHGRNRDWVHLANNDILSMPDKWEYPWFAAWDLAFHCVPLSLVDAEFAKHQLLLLTHEWYMHPNGQLPAYEWNFGDANPPVHAWSAWRVFEIDRERSGGQGDLAFLERVFHKLIMNYCWWTNRKDSHDRNVFQGGFLGLDNISLFDRNTPLPSGVNLQQADGTAWMAMYALNMLRIALELASHDAAYDDIATKFFDHFHGIAWAMNNPGSAFHEPGLWDEEDGFYYDKLRAADGRAIRLKVRSLVGLIPLCAVETLDPELLTHLKGFEHRLKWFKSYEPDLAPLVAKWLEPGDENRQLLTLLRGERLERVLRLLLDETEFLSDYGIRAVSQYHRDHPCEMTLAGQSLRVDYWPGESESGQFGGNSNWRGPIWFPINFLIVESLRKFHRYYGDDFRVSCPTGSGTMLNCAEVADELTRRLSRIFLRDEDGKRAVFGNNDKLHTDAHFRDYLLFYEYFHGDTGRGVGASHQTGWTGLIAELLRHR